MTNNILFLVVILITHIIHGITGFAGTMLAMPPGLMLVGYNIAKPVLNVIALFAGIYVCAGNYKNVNWKELRKICAVMIVGIVGGMYIKGLFAGNESVLYKILGAFIVFIAVQGLYKMFKGNAEVKKENSDNPIMSIGLLIIAGLAHGLFVSGGPPLISYLTKKLPDKAQFRATISTVWVFLNTIILIDDIRAGLWTATTLQVGAIATVVMFAAMYIGGKLYAIMSQRVFLILTYILLFISGMLLVVK